jgi:hypothetical protein
MLFGMIRSVTGAAGAVVRLPAGIVGRAAVALVDGALRSPYADDVVDRVLISGVAERAIARDLSGELVDVVARDIVRHR